LLILSAAALLVIGIGGGIALWRAGASSIAGAVQSTSDSPIPGNVEVAHPNGAKASPTEPLSGQAPAPGERAASDLDRPVATEKDPHELRAEVLATFLSSSGAAVVIRGRLMLDTDDRAHFEAAVDDQTSCRIKNLPLAVYHARVQAVGFVHRGQDFDLSVGHAAAGGKGLAFHERVILFPARSLPLVVETPDKQPLAELAAAVGADPRRILAGAFSVRAAIEETDVVSCGNEPDPLAVFVAPPGFLTWQATERCVGSVELRGELPFSVALTFWGRPLAWRRVVGGESELVYPFSSADLEACFGTLALRVVDSIGPVSDAKATLVADLVMPRGPPKEERTADARGAVRFERVVPGRYTISVVRGEAIYESLVSVVSGQVRDLGDILIDPATAVVVRVVDGAGKPKAASLQLAPYARSGRLEDMFPLVGSSHRTVDGVCRLPAPQSISVLRATTGMATELSAGRPARSYLRGPRSACVLLDPEHLPIGTLLVSVADPTAVTIVVDDGAASIEIADELGLVVSWANLDAEREHATELVPGSYQARALDGAGRAKWSKDFTVGTDAVLVRLP
jgi:hypothetical protein